MPLPYAAALTDLDNEGKPKPEDDNLTWKVSSGCVRCMIGMWGLMFERTGFDEWDMWHEVVVRKQRGRIMVSMRLRCLFMCTRATSASF